MEPQAFRNIEMTLSQYSLYFLLRIEEKLFVYFSFTRYLKANQPINQLTKSTQICLLVLLTLYPKTWFSVLGI